MAWPGSPFRRSSVTLTRKSSTSSLTPYRVPGPTPTKSRPTRYWSTVYADQCHKLSQKVSVKFNVTCTASLVTVFHTLKCVKNVTVYNYTLHKSIQKTTGDL